MLRSSIHATIPLLLRVVACGRDSAHRWMTTSESTATYGKSSIAGPSESKVLRLSSNRAVLPRVEIYFKLLDLGYSFLLLCPAPLDNMARSCAAKRAL